MYLIYTLVFYRHVDPFDVTFIYSVMQRETCVFCKCYVRVPEICMTTKQSRFDVILLSDGRWEKPLPSLQPFKEKEGKEGRAWDRDQ